MAMASPNCKSPAWCRTPPKSGSRGISENDACGSPSCPLVSRVPALNRSGDWAEDARREGERSSFIDLLNTLWAHPERITDTSNFAKKWGESKSTTECAQKWVSIPTVVGKVDKLWCTRWLGKHGIREAALDKENLRDPTFINHLFCMVLGLSPTMTMPEILRQDPVLAEAWFDDRVRELGRLTNVQSAFAGGKYDFGVGSVYVLKWAEGDAAKLTHIEHIGGTTAEVPGHLLVTNEWKLTQWYNDAGATLQLAPISHTISKLWQAGTGPHLLKMTAAQFRDRVLAFDRKRKEAMASSDDGMPMHSLLSESRKRKQDELAARAKETLQRHKAARKVLSEISLR